MKLPLILQLASVASAFVLPNQDVFTSIDAEAAEVSESFEQSSRNPSKPLGPCAKLQIEPAPDRVRDLWNKYSHKAHYAVDTALEQASNVVESASKDATDFYSDARNWVESSLPADLTDNDPLGLLTTEEETTHPSKGKGGHGHTKGNSTVYELIAKSEYTTELAKRINEFPDLVEALNKTDARYTVFAPTDRAFKNIPKHAPKPSKEFLKKIISYHVSPDFYPAGRVLAGRTIPTLLTTDNLSDEEVPQRISTQVSLKGLTVNFYSRILAINIFASNGVIHAVDSIILPPPPGLKIIDLLPEEFSTLELGLIKTGLFDLLNTTDHKGGTLFAPSNFAFLKLGPRANAFLFSPRGVKYLRAILKYHIVPEKTLYSDHYIEGHPSKDEAVNVDRPRRGPPRGYKHFDLPTLLDDKELAVDVSRYGRLIDIQLNGYTHVTTSDGIAQNGVVHEVNNVIIPSHDHGGSADIASVLDGKGEVDVDRLVEYLEPLLDEEDFEPVDL